MRAEEFLSAIREIIPYARHFEGKTFIVALRSTDEEKRRRLCEDLNLLLALGVRLVVVLGAPPGLLPEEPSAPAISFEVMENISAVMAKEAFLWQASFCARTGSTPMAASRRKVLLSNLVLARPYGVRGGKDHGYFGETRAVDAAGLRALLGQGYVFLLPVLAPSATGELFLLDHAELAGAVARAVSPEKLIFFLEENAFAPLLPHAGQALDLEEAQDALGRLSCGEALAALRAACAYAKHVEGVHLLPAKKETLLLEIFTHQGVGVMVRQNPWGEMRPAKPEDLPAIAALIAPLEQTGALRLRSRHMLEEELGYFHVLEEAGMILGTVAVLPYLQEEAAEIACLAVHPDVQKMGAGDRLLRCALDEAKVMGAKRVFALSTMSVHWFLERGFMRSAADALPLRRQEHYDLTRRPIVLVKELS